MLFGSGPSWEPTILGVTIPSPFLPGIVAPAIIFGGIMLWPFVEARVSGDRREHHLLDLPWEAPVRLAIGSAVLTMFIVLTLAGANDVLAVLFNVDVGALTAAFRVLLIVGPLVVGLVAYRLAIEIRARSGRPIGSGRRLGHPADGRRRVRGDRSVSHHSRRSVAASRRSLGASSRSSSPAASPRP